MMNEESIQEKVFQWVSITAQNIGDWAAKEIPPFIHEYLLWKFWENMLGIGAFIGGMVIFGIIWAIIYKFIYKPVKRFCEEPETSQDDKQFSQILMYGFMALMVLISLVTFGKTFPYQNIVNCVQIKIAPKVYLISEAARIIGK